MSDTIIIIFIILIIIAFCGLLIKFIFIPIVNNLDFPRKTIMSYLEENNLEFESKKRIPYSKTPFKNSNLIDSFDWIQFRVTFYKIRSKNKSNTSNNTTVWLIAKASNSFFIKSEYEFFLESELKKFNLK